MTWFTKAESGVKSSAAYFTLAELEILITTDAEKGHVFKKNLMLQLKLNSVMWHRKRLQLALICQATFSGDSNAEDQQL